MGCCRVILWVLVNTSLSRVANNAPGSSSSSLNFANACFQPGAMVVEDQSDFDAEVASSETSHVLRRG